jgi:hypothetical protein
VDTGNLGITRRFRYNGTGDQKSNCSMWWLLFVPAEVMKSGAFLNPRDSFSRSE